jgi:hypothetical protein
MFVPLYIRMTHTFAREIKVGGLYDQRGAAKFGSAPSAAFLFGFPHTITMIRQKKSWVPAAATRRQIGLLGSSIVEAIAGLQFYLYGKATRQFGAFHICLERTHRYLLAYKMAEQMSSGKDDALQNIVCIMANAPMITRQDIEGVESGVMKTPTAAPTSIVSASVGTP